MLSRSPECYRLLCSALVLLGLTLAPTVKAQDAEESNELRASRVVRAALREGLPEASRGSILAQLAWPDPALPRDSWVEHRARMELISIGADAIGDIDHMHMHVSREQSADLVMTLIAARKRQRAGIPRDFLPAMDRAVWFGSTDARRLAIPILAKNGSYGTMQACIDAALEEPTLLPMVIRSTVGFGRDSSRHFLKTQLESGDPHLIQLAAESLASIGARARDTLRDATLSDSAEIREIAIRALLPLTGTSDLTALYEYLSQFANDEEQLVAEVGERTVMLESLLELQQAYDSDQDN